MIIKTLNTTHSFEVVEKIPAGFFVWNIGKNMGIDEYIPLCELLHPENKNDCSINADTLKAIKLDTSDVMLLRKAASFGVHDLKTAKKALNRKNPKGYVTRRRKELAEKTIEIFERISK